MSQTWGRSRSDAYLISSGGFHVQPSPRHGSPPMNLAPSQATTMRSAKVTKTPARRSQPRSGDRGIGDLERAIDDREPFCQLLLADRQRRVGEEVVPPDERVEAVLAESLPKCGHLVARA